MLLKKISSSWSLSKSAAMTVRTGEGMENLGEAMSWRREGCRSAEGRVGMGFCCVWTQRPESQSLLIHLLAKGPGVAAFRTT